MNSNRTRFNNLIIDQWQKIALFLLLLIFVVLSGLLLIISEENWYSNNSIEQGNNIKRVTEPTEINGQNIVDIYLKDKCTETANVLMTECTIEQLDRVAAEREWKQRKLETIKSPQIDENNIIIGSLEDKQPKMTKWRLGFEKMRDDWCNARYILMDGSGVPGEIAICQLDFELLAIKDLNSIYYDVIMSPIYSSEGIPNFELKKEDIDQLIKTNITSRGCIWAGETNCNGENSKTDINKIISSISNGDCFKYVDIIPDKTKKNGYYKPTAKAGCIIVNTDPSAATLAALNSTSSKPVASYGTKMLCPCD